MESSKLGKKCGIAVVPGVAISIMLVAGYNTKIKKGVDFSLSSVLAILVMGIVLTSIVLFLFHILDKGGKNYRSIPWPNRAIKNSTVWYFITCLIIIVLWMPLFFAFYPGLFAYDAQWQYGMYITGEVSTHQPVLHTYMLGMLVDTFYRLTGSINKGIAVYTLVQMLILALGCAYVPYKLYSWKCSSAVQFFSVFFYGLFPVITIFVFTSTKDSFFSVAIADLTALMIEYAREKGEFWDHRSNKVLFIVFVIEILILRNNAVYPIIIMLPFFVYFIMRERKNVRKALVTIAVIAALYLVYKYPITNILATERVSKAEMLSVPCQQIMRVYKYHYDELSNSEKEAVEALFDLDKWYGYYVPEIADATKGSLRMDVYNHDSSLFWSTWKLLLKEYPNEYIDSMLENTYGFWYPWPHYVIYSFGGEGYTPIVTMEPGEQNSKLPGLYKIYKNFENGAIVQSSYGISWLFAPATYMYISLIILFYTLKQKNYRYMLIFGFLMLLWCTYLLGPVAMVRYSLYLYMLVPIWPALISNITYDEIKLGKKDE